MKKPDFEKGQIRLWNTDCVEFIQSVPSESIDVICIDPPYLYLKNQKLERPFDERLFFSECKRILADKGFIVMFGRGVSFYRWNCLMNELGMTFKEEIVWDKKRASSPLASLSRVHEMAVIYSKGKGSVNRVKLPYLESRDGDIENIKKDIKKLMPILKHPHLLAGVEYYMDTGLIPFEDKLTTNVHRIKGDANRVDRAIYVAATIHGGMNEKSIISEIGDHRNSIHPTQKPVRLLERLLALVIPYKPRNEIIVADFFGGSMSCMEAVYNMGMNGISCEIDKEYFNAGKERIESLLNKGKQSELF